MVWKLSSFDLLDLFLNPMRDNEKKLISEYVLNMTKSLFDASHSLLSSRAYPNLFRLLRHTALPCFPEDVTISPGHMLKSCQWGGQEVDCRKLFTPVPTDSGMCCAFNTKNILRHEEACRGDGQDTEYPCLVLELQNRTGAERKHTKKATFGKNKGLKVTLDRHSNLDSLQTVVDNDNGFRVFIGDPTEFPMLNNDQLLLSTGHRHLIRLSASHVSSTNEVLLLQTIVLYCTTLHHTVGSYTMQTITH